MTLFDLGMGAYKTKEMEIVIVYHYNKTNSERTDTYTTSDFIMDISYRDQQAKVMMFEPTKKGHLKIWCYLEIDE